MGDGIRNLLLSNLYRSNFAELELGLFVSDAVDGESALDVVDETKVFASLLDRDDICVRVICIYIIEINV